MSQKKIIIVPLLLLATIYFCAALIKKTGYGLTYQISASMPRGFYLIKPAEKIKRGDIIVFYPPKKIATFLLQHKWIAPDKLLMKHVAAITGDYVCKHNATIFINHKKVAHITHYYAPGKPLPSKPFCTTLKKNQYLALSTKIKRSFDGRYFGPIDKKTIVGKAVKLF